MSGRAGRVAARFALAAAVGCGDADSRFAAGRFPAGESVAAPPAAHAPCAQPSVALAISSPGWIGLRQSLQDVA